MGKHDKVCASGTVAAVPSGDYEKARIKELENRLALSEQTNKRLTEELQQYRKAVASVVENCKNNVEKMRDENAKLRAKIVKLVETYV